MIVDVDIKRDGDFYMIRFMGCITFCELTQDPIQIAEQSVKIAVGNHKGVEINIVNNIDKE